MAHHRVSSHRTSSGMRSSMSVGWTSGAGGNYMEWRDFGRPTADEVGSVSGRLSLLLRKHSHVANLVNFARRAMRRGAGKPAEVLGARQW